MEPVKSIEEPEDSLLLREIGLGNSYAFATLYDRHSTLIFSVALRMLCDREEARDIVQQVFLKVLQKSNLYRPAVGKPLSWLCMVTRNQCLDRLRQRKSRKILGESYAGDHASSLSPGYESPRYAQFSDEVGLLNGAMAILKPQEVTVLQLAYFMGLSQKEIADKLSLPLGSVKARIRRSLVKLRSALDGVVHPVVEGAVRKVSLA